MHDARKRIKKVRALLRLVRPGLGDTYKKENAFYRDLGRDLSDIRDAQVMSQTVGSLKCRAPSEAVSELLAPVARWTDARRAQVVDRRCALTRIRDTQSRLISLRKRIADWELSDEPAASALTRGLKKTYKRARNRFNEALASPDPALLHEWRKRTKYHWYHCRLLREAWRDEITPRIEALDDLADSLDDDHDLAVLDRALRENAGGDIPDASILAARDLAARTSHEMRTRAFAIAPSLFVEKPEALTARLAAYWVSAALHVAS